MCGISGIYFSDPARHVDERMLWRMSRALRHRGPDDEGIHADRNVGLAHQRLSIIDLSPEGRQPMSNEDGRLWVVLNGEIYNYREIRAELAARGHRFRSESDTEVLVHLYEEDGPACVRRLIGMFAFAIWDSRERTLFAARDHFGVKPFYYACVAEAFLFASEIKALFATGLVAPELNRDGLSDYLTFQFCLGDKTLFRQVHMLMPGRTLTLAGPGATPTIGQYWSLDFTIDTHHTETYFRERLRELVDDSVRLQVRADVPVGAHLSGGFDSSTVACLTAALKGRIHTFSGGFHHGPRFDETGYALLVARHIGADHHEVFPTASDFVAAMPRLIYHMDEPAAGPGLFPQYFVSRLARQHVKVVLGGQGGDELFGGYVRYLMAYLEDSIKGRIDGTPQDDAYVVTLESVLPNLRQLQGYEPMLRHFWKEGLFEAEERRYFRLIDRRDGIDAVIHTGVLPSDTEYSSFEAFSQLYGSCRAGSLINRLTWFDMQTLLPALLHVEDRASMSVSLESRVPLLDHRIAELVASMPPKVKYQGGRSKHILREVMRPIIPEEVYSRTDKMGFPVPLNEWYAASPVREFLNDTLLGARARARGIVRTERLETRLASEEPYARGVWGLLCLELWMQAFLDGSTQPD